MHFTLWGICKFVYLFSAILYFLAEGYIILNTISCVNCDANESYELDKKITELDKEPFPFADLAISILYGFIPVLNTYLAFALVKSCDSLIHTITDIVEQFVSDSNNSISNDKENNTNEY